MNITSLSFIIRPARGIALAWDVPPTDDYHGAVARGEELAVEYMNYLRLNPSLRGSATLCAIARAFGPQDNPGYMVGFMGQVERMVFTGLKYVDPVNGLIAQRKFYAQALAKVEETIKQEDEETAHVA